MPGPEATIERNVVKDAKRGGWLAFKWTSPNRRGVLDDIFFKAKRFVALEFKRPGAKATPLQLRTVDALRREGFEAYVVDSEEEAKRILDLA